MEQAGLQVRVDSGGNVCGIYGQGARLTMGSHLDTAPHAGAFDGLLGVLIAIALVERKPPCAVQVAAFSAEEGVRFIDEPVRGYLEFHSEQGPVLESLGLPLGVVEAIAGQSCWDVRFHGRANHAGATPMNLRRDALACAAEWIGLVEHLASNTAGLVATVGRLEVLPGAANVIAGEARASLDVRHELDEVRQRALETLLDGAEHIARQRALTVEGEPRLDHPAVSMNFAAMEEAVAAAGYPVHRMASGAEQNGMIRAQKLPSAMLFLRSQGGIRHHPEESVLREDVDAALAVGSRFLENWGPV
jgi:allantoate deiminase